MTARWSVRETLAWSALGFVLFVAIGLSVPKLMWWATMLLGFGCAMVAAGAVEVVHRKR